MDSANRSESASPRLRQTGSCRRLRSGEGHTRSESAEVRGDLGWLRLPRPTLLLRRPEQKPELARRSFLLPHLMRLLRFAASWHWGQVAVIWAFAAIVCAISLSIYRRQDSIDAASEARFEAEGRRTDAETGEVWNAAAQGFPDDRASVLCAPLDSRCRLSRSTGIPPEIVARHERHIRNRIQQMGESPQAFLRADSVIRTTHRELADSLSRVWSSREQRELQRLRDEYDFALESIWASNGRTHRTRQLSLLSAALAAALALLTLWSWSSAKSSAG